MVHVSTVLYQECCLSELFFKIQPNSRPVSLFFLIKHCVNLKEFKVINIPD